MPHNRFIGKCFSPLLSADGWHADGWCCAVSLPVLFRSICDIAFGTFDHRVATLPR
jgi:hypothetical protein